MNIWCSGLSSTNLLPIHANKVDVWQALLQQSYGWQDVDTVPVRLRRLINLGVALDRDHWSQWNDMGLVT